MMKFESVAKIGEFIKAMDFRPMEDRDDSFVIGKIISKGRMFANSRSNIDDDRPVIGARRYIGEGYTIECVFDTEGERVRREIGVPFEVGMTDWDDRVQYVSEGAYKRIIGMGGL